MAFGVWSTAALRPSLSGMMSWLTLGSFATWTLYLAIAAVRICWRLAFGALGAVEGVAVDVVRALMTSHRQRTLSAMIAPPGRRSERARMSS